MKNKNYLFVSSNMITNFKPSSATNFNSIENIKKNNKQKYCKNFLIYILLFKYKNNFFKKSNIFVKKYKKKLHTILRSPYRHKLARHQIFLTRYKINFSIFIPLFKIINIKNFSNSIKLIHFVKKFSNIFESNIIYTNNIKISIPILYANLFILLKSKKINFKNK